jgi:hypothetical protein
VEPLDHQACRCHQDEQDNAYEGAQGKEQYRPPEAEQQNRAYEYPDNFSVHVREPFSYFYKV